MVEATLLGAGMRSMSLQRPGQVRHRPRST
jgi:hypothetical protein